MKSDVGRQGTNEHPQIRGPVPCRDTESLTTSWSYPETVELLVRPQGAKSMASDKTDSHDSARSSYLEEVTRQLAILSGLIAGFAFAALTQVSFEATTCSGLKQAFILCASLAVLLELLAAFTAAIMTFVLKFRHFDELWLNMPFSVAGIAFSLGLVLVLVATVLVVWIKAAELGLIVSVAAGLVVLLMVYVLYYIGSRSWGAAENST